MAPPILHLATLANRNEKPLMPSVVVILPPAIGDVMMAVPLLRELSAAGWSVDTIADESLSPFAETYPPLGKQYAVPIKQWRKTPIVSDLAGRLRLAFAVRRARYDALIQVGTGSLGIWLSWFARIPIRVAQDVHHHVLAKRLAFTAIMRQRVKTTEYHAAAQNLEFARALGIEPTIQRPRASGGGTHVIVAPDASLIGRTLPPAEVARIVEALGQNGHPVLMVGTHGGTAEQIAHDYNLPTSHISAPLERIVSAVRAAACVIATDSGIGHLAAVCGTPVVSIFGPGDPAKIAPWSEDMTAITPSLPCHPCGRNGCQDSGVSTCLTGLPVGRILSAVAVWAAGNDRVA